MSTALTWARKRLLLQWGRLSTHGLAIRACDGAQPHVVRAIPCRPTFDGDGFPDVQALRIPAPAPQDRGRVGLGAPGDLMATLLDRQCHHAVRVGEAEFLHHAGHLAQLTLRVEEHGEGVMCDRTAATDGHRERHAQSQDDSGLLLTAGHATQYPRIHARGPPALAVPSARWYRRAPMRIDIYCAFCERITDPALLAR